MKYRVNETCIGCGLCVSLCPEVFHMTDADVAQAPEEDVPEGAEATAMEAKDSCPVEAVEEVEGE